MSYYVNLQKAIDYVEQNLNDNIELAQAAKIAGYSIPHFYRLFDAIIGCSIIEYARKRRLSNALYELVTTNKSITEIAFQYGFKSHEVFTRTFKSIYGAPPNFFRRAYGELQLFEKINLLSKTNDKDIMFEPEIVCNTEILLVGLTRSINKAEDIRYAYKLKLKRDFIGMIDNIENRIKPDVFYAVYDYDPENLLKQDDDIYFNYYCCAEVSKYNTIPEGTIKKIIPLGKYAVFHYDIKGNMLNGKKLSRPVYKYIDGIWLPNSGYEFADIDTPDYEIINEKEGIVYYHVAIK